MWGQSPRGEMEGSGEKGGVAAGGVSVLPAAEPCARKRKMVWFMLCGFTTIKKN